jgi:sugar phosphate permease
MTPLFFVNERNFSLIEANHLLSISRIPGIFMVMLSGWLTDRLSVSLTAIFAALLNEKNFLAKCSDKNRYTL